MFLQTHAICPGFHWSASLIVVADCRKIVSNGICQHIDLFKYHRDNSANPTLLEKSRLIRHRENAFLQLEEVTIYRNWYTLVVITNYSAVSQLLYIMSDIRLFRDQCGNLVCLAAGSENLVLKICSL